MREKYYAEITVTYKIPLEVVMDFETDTPMPDLELQLDESFDAEILEGLPYEKDSLIKCVQVYYTKPGED